MPDKSPLARAHEAIDRLLHVARFCACHNGRCRDRRRQGFCYVAGNAHEFVPGVNGYIDPLCIAARKEAHAALDAAVGQARREMAKVISDVHGTGDDDAS